MKFEHSTCKEDLHKKRLCDIKDIVTSKFVIYLIILVFVYLIPLLLFYINPLVDLDCFSFWLGVGAWIIFYDESQVIISKNLFKQFTLLGTFILVLSGILIMITKSGFINFRMTLYPLFYLFYFRILLFLFFKNFASSTPKPTILFASRGGNWTHKNPSPYYIVSTKERIFSNLLFFGSFALMVFILLLES